MRFRGWGISLEVWHGSDRAQGGGRAFITEYRINRTTAEKAQKEHSSMAETVTRMLGKASQEEVEEVSGPCTPY